MPPGAMFVNQCGTPAGTMRKSPLLSFCGVPPSMDFPVTLVPLRVAPTIVPPVIIVAVPSITT